MPGDGDVLRVRARVAGERGARPRLDVALEVPPSITAVMGASGAGKTTLLAAVAGLVRPEAGRITLGEDVLYDGAARAWVAPHRRRVALMFQSIALFPHLSVWQNVAYGLPRATPRAARRAQAEAWLTRVHVGHLAGREPATLSGGEAQRVALARALASGPRALLLDEPFSALHADLRRALGADLRALVEGLRIPTLLVTHDPHDAAALGTRVLQLEDGRLVP